MTGLWRSGPQPTVPGGRPEAVYLVELFSGTGYMIHAHTAREAVTRILDRLPRDIPLEDVSEVWKLLDNGTLERVAAQPGKVLRYTPDAEGE